MASKTATLGNWIRVDRKSIAKFLKRIKRNEVITHPSVLALQELIETDPEVNMLFKTMFTQAPATDPQNPIKNYTDMLQQMDVFIGEAPRFEDTAVPINHLLMYVMPTPSGSIAFINDKVNKCFREILRSWAQFLNSPDSQSVLNTTDGWLSPESLETMPNFVEIYACDPAAPYYGFKSWNDFFARKLRDNVRPVADPCDPFIITSPCEATPYYIEKNPHLRDTFWIKAQPYSLQHLLNDDPLTESFVGGTVYQGFLSSANYHRWHAPVDGTVTKAYIKEGAYYAEALSEGFDPTANTYSQRYLSHVDTRAIVMIDTGNPKIGTVAFLAVGMAEIASCPIDLYFGQKVKKGDPMGTFEFGGSTYCLLFQKGVNIKFTVEDIQEKYWPKIIQNVNSKIASIEQ